MQRLHICKLSLVRSTISGWHHIEKDLISLYDRLVDLGMEYRNGDVYLADLEEENERTGYG